MEDYLDLTPATSILAALRAERPNHRQLIGEAVDNSFDANAKSIEIARSELEVRFEDDGTGVSRDRIRALLRLGEHGPMTSTMLGRFGVGLKHQAVSAGDKLDIESVSAEGRMHLSVDWRKLERSGNWRSQAAPKWLPVAVGRATGTIVTISELRKPPALSEAQIIQFIQRTFHPALIDGRTIVFNGHHIAPLPDPKMTMVVERQLEFDGGRSASLRAGLLDREDSFSMVHISVGHRVILNGETIGCGDYGGLTRLFARVRLIGPWDIARFKNELTNEGQRDELNAALEEAMRPILEACDSASLSATVDTFEQMLNDRLPAQWQAVRPRRKGQSRGKVKERTDKRGVVEPDQAEESGPMRSLRPPKNRLQISLDGILADHGLGITVFGKPDRVMLSRAHPYIAAQLSARNQQLAVESVYMAAIMTYVGERRMRQPDLFEQPFGVQVAALFGLQDTALDERALAGLR